MSVRSIRPTAKLPLDVSFRRILLTGTIGMAGELEANMNYVGDAVLKQTDIEVGCGKWSESRLDARFDKQERSWIGKIRAINMDGNTVSVGLDTDISLGLIALEECRGEGVQEWYGVLLTVRPNRHCHVGLNYDDQCALDDTFYDT